jgi:uroporphyrinogen decarboxylase
MDSRERVLTALAHRQPDRTPRDFWAEEPTWNRLCQHLGCQDRERILRQLGIDLRHFNAETPPDQALPQDVHQNFWGERFIYRETGWGPMREDIPGALASAQTLDELKAFAWPTPDAFDYSGLKDLARRHADCALVYGFADVWQRPALVRGWEQMFVDMAERPDWAHFLCGKFTEFYLEDYARAAEATQGRIDLFLLISDLGCQRGPLISPAMFREFVAPYLKRMIDQIHRLGARVLYHSCGGIRAFIPELIRLGIDVLDPLQPTDPGMSPERLKADFGGQLCFHGGIDVQHLLPRASQDEVKHEVRRYCQTLGRSGGYVLGPTHFFQPDVPPENIVAVYQEAP